MSTRRFVADLLLIAAAIAALALGSFTLLLLMIALAVVATGEVFRLTRATGVIAAVGIGFLGAVMLLIVAHLEGEDATMFFPIVIAGVVLLAFVTMLSRRNRRDVTDGLAMTMVPVLAVGLLASYVIALRSGRDGFEVALALTLMAVANDLVSGLVDPRRGRRPLAPTVRPARTWEGLGAGAVATIVIAVVVGVVFDPPFSIASAVVLGVLVSAAAPLGDLSRAMLERDLRAEASTVAAPRATVLRRIDGLLFSAPVFFYVFRVLER